MYSCEDELKPSSLRNCRVNYDLSCARARTMLEPFQAINITWDMMIDHTGVFLAIDSRTNKLHLLRSPNLSSDLPWFTNHDKERIQNLLNEETPGSILLPINREDSSISRCIKYKKYPVISFCQKADRIDILWPSAQDYTYNATDYTINKNLWLTKENQAWFRGEDMLL